MFPSALSRLVDAAAELADAVLAPAPLVEPGGRARDATHPHRRPLRDATGRAPRTAARRPGTIAPPAQPCLTPLTHGRLTSAPTPGAGAGAHSGSAA